MLHATCQTLSGSIPQHCGKCRWTGSTKWWRKKMSLRTTFALVLWTRWSTCWCASSRKAKARQRLKRTWRESRITCGWEEMEWKWMVRISILSILFAVFFCECAVFNWRPSFVCASLRTVLTKNSAWLLRCCVYWTTFYRYQRVAALGYIVYGSSIDWVWDERWFQNRLFKSKWLCWPDADPSRSSRSWPLLPWHYKRRLAVQHPRHWLGGCRLYASHMNAHTHAFTHTFTHAFTHARIQYHNHASTVVSWLVACEGSSWQMMLCTSSLQNCRCRCARLYLPSFHVDSTLHGFL